MSDLNKQNELNEAESSKTEMANRIADQSKRVANTYQHIEDGILRIVRWFSTILDKTLFSRKYAKSVSLVIALLMYFVVNFNSQSSLYTTSVRSARDLNGVTVTAKYNMDTFELSGLPESANITIEGDASSVTTAYNTRGAVVADLEGLTEGTHQVKLKTEGFGDSVDVKIDPSNVTVTLKKKTTQQFDLSYDFINQDKMDSIYSVGTPDFEYTKVNVRASKDTLNTISFVKALIDVSGQTSDFTYDAMLVAYDRNGQPVNADIVPSTVTVTVPVTSPNKTVPIQVEVTGEVSNEMAIASIEMDQQTVTIYGPDNVLGQINKVVVTLNASTLTKDSTVMRPITLPTGVNSSNINQITMTVTLGEGVTRKIEDVPINYKNNVNNYKASPAENSSYTTSVNVYGTQENVDSITADDIYVYVDMKDAVPGINDFPLEVEQPTDGLIKYSLTESTYSMNVLGNVNTDTETVEGAGANNG